MRRSRCAQCLPPRKQADAQGRLGVGPHRHPPRRMLKQKRERKLMRERTGKGTRMRRCRSQRGRHTYFGCQSQSSGDRPDPAARGGARRVQTAAYRPIDIANERPIGSRPAGWSASSSHHLCSAACGPRWPHQLRGEVGAGLPQRLAPQAIVVAAPRCGTPTTDIHCVQTGPSNNGIERKLPNRASAIRQLRSSQYWRALAAVFGGIV